MKYYEQLYLVLIIVYIIAFAVITNLKKLPPGIPPELKNLSVRDKAIFSIVGGTFVGSIFASIIWFLISASYNMFCAVSSECFEVVEENMEDEKKVEENMEDEKKVEENMDEVEEEKEDEVLELVM